jgi:hypothetical protein
MASMMGQIEKVQDYIPLMRMLPDKVGSVEIGLDELKDRMVKNYVTFLQVEETIRIHMGEVERRCRDENKKILDQMLKDLNNRIPS